MKTVIGLFAGLLLAASQMVAEEKRDHLAGKIGITLPTTGAIWHISDRAAIVPSVSYSHSWIGYLPLTGGPELRGTSGSLTIAADLRLYSFRWKEGRFYLAPGYSLRRTTSLTTSGVQNPYYYHSVAGKWGLEYSLGTRLVIYGDVGGAVLWNDAFSTETRTFSTSGSWGLIFYLR
jgi:hypothetical protein